MPDGVRLVVDHKIPKAWGGTSEPSNLWALCTECNAGKKDHFASQDDEVMRKVMHHDSVHFRLGELLKAYAPEPVPSHLMAFVAQQADWMKRTRELRYLGWEFTTTRKRVDKKDVVFYTLLAWKPWNSSNPSAEIAEYERKRATSNRGRR